MHQVIVNNVGVVWTGESEGAANRAFNKYVERSSTGVVWVCDGAMVMEFTPNPSYNPTIHGR